MGIERTGPVTPGEHRTLAGIITGLEPENVDAAILIVVTTCPDCGLQKLVTTTDLAKTTTISVLFSAIQEIGMGVDHVD